LLNSVNKFVTRITANLVTLKAIDNGEVFFYKPENVVYKHTIRCSVPIPVVDFINILWL
jgi:hypothetical protein